MRKDYVATLEQRLKDVEHALQRHDDLLTGHLSACPEPSSERLAKSSIQHASPFNNRHLHDGIQLDMANIGDHGPEDANTDGLAIVVVDEQTPEFHGESSNIAFTRCLLQAMSVISKVAVPYKESSSYNAAPPHKQQSLSSHETSNNPHHLPTTLPPVEEMDSLLSAYFRIYGSLFPFLHELTFRKMYEKCKNEGSTAVRRTWLGLLNMTFAMASNVDQSDEISTRERFRKSYVFYVRAVSLCSDSLMRLASLDMVQYLLLAVLYLQGTQKSTQSWNVHGILVKMAIALGLHSEQSGRNLDLIQREVRRRTWLTIYCLDTLLSATFGRPPSIPNEYIVVQLPSAWISATDIPRPHLNTMDINTEFLSATVRLHQIMGRSIASQYSMNLGLSHEDADIDGSSAIQTASIRRQELQRWASSLPPHLNLCELGSEVLTETSDSSRLRVILTSRYYFTSILIHRPLLYSTLRYLTTKEPPIVGTLPFRIQLAMAEAHECIRSAENMIEVIHSVLKSQKTSHSNLGVWFFTLFYGTSPQVSTSGTVYLLQCNIVFTSSLVLVARSVLTHYQAYPDDDSTSRSVDFFLTKAEDSLDRLDKDNRLVHNCAKFIRQLSERKSSESEFA